MLCQVNDFWDKVDKQTISEDDIAEYIYSSEYLNIQNPTEFCKIKNTYNPDLMNKSVKNGQ